MKRIVVVPCFGEGHFIELQLQNLIDNLNPTHIIYNEGLFPQGPENKGGMNEDFKSTFCYKDTNLGWDTELIQSTIKKYQEKYPEIDIIWKNVEYKEADAAYCYTHAVSNFDELGIEIQQGDIIFPLEGDVFFHENDIELLNSMIDELKPDEGLQAPFLDFWQNQYYTEGDSLNQDLIRKRRIVMKFGTWEFYKNVVLNFSKEKYPQLKLFPRYIFHYSWWRPGKYLELRFKQLVRPAQYHQDMREALELAKEGKKEFIDLRKDRPVNMLARYLAKIDIDHPSHAKKHPNYIK